MSNEPRRNVREYRKDPMAFIEDLTVPCRGEPRFGNVMADFQRERFLALVPDLLACSRKQTPPIGYHWWEATKGASKDSDLAAGVLWLLAFSRRRVFGQAGAADAGQAGELRKAASEWLGVNPWLEKRIKVFRREIRCDANGSSVEIETADEATAHGARPDFLVINELHAIKSESIASTWYDNADKVEHGIVVVATNAGFANTWQWRWREQARSYAAQDLPECFFHKFDRPAPWISEKKLRRSRERNTTARYNRLWGGVWAAAGGDALDPLDVDACIRERIPEPVRDVVYLAGLDLGVKHDHAALVVLRAEFGGRIALSSCESWAPGPDGKIDLMGVETAVLQVHRRFGLVWAGYDPHQAALMAQRLEAAGLPMVEVPFVGKNLDLMAREVLQTFRNRKIDLYRDDLLLNDLFRLTIEEKSYGYRLTSTADDTGHADRAIALAIVLPTALAVTMAAPPDDDADDGMAYRVVA